MRCEVVKLTTHFTNNSYKETLGYSHKLPFTRARTKFARLAENICVNMQENMEIAQPEVQLIVDRGNRDPTNMNSFLKVRFTRYR